MEKQTEYLAKVAAKKHNVPYYGVREYSPKTMAMWVRAYRKGGFEELKPKTRNDKGKSRVLTPELKEVILEAREDHPDRSVSLLYDQLITEKKMLPSQASYSTVYRFLKKKNLCSLTHRSMPFIQFVFLKPKFCLQLPSDSTLRWTPLSSANG